MNRTTKSPHLVSFRHTLIDPGCKGYSDMRITRDFIVPVIGLAFFWSYFRFQRFISVLYPPSFSHSFNGIPLHDSLLLVGSLAAVGLVCLSARSLLCKDMGTHKALVLTCTLAGSVGAWLLLSIQRSAVSFELPLIASLLVALGFIANTLAWAIHFSAAFTLRSACILMISYMTSLVLFPALSLMPHSPALLAICAPALSGTAWFLTPQPKEYTFDQSVFSLRFLSPGALLCVAFLIAGSAIRGIVYVSEGGGEQRVMFILLAFSACTLFWIFCGQPNPVSPSSHIASSTVYTLIERAAFRCWEVLALLFIFALFISSAFPHIRFGGDLVVVARSFFMPLLWVILCSLSSYKRVSPVLLIILCCVFVEALSWCLSYSLAPILLYLPGAGLPMQSNIALVVVFSLFSMVIVILGIATRRQADMSRNREYSSSAWKISDDFAEVYKLTEREREVADLFLQGRSLKKVASLLVISPNTVQSHIKSVYRKLDIHSKDELIDLVEKWYDR